MITVLSFPVLRPPVFSRFACTRADEAYHQLNHYNLFGGGYRNAALSCLAEVERG